MSLTRIGSIGINTGIAFAGVTTIVTLNTANDALSIGATVNVGSGITLGASGDIFATGVSTFSGNLKVGSGVTISPDGDGFYTGVVTATSFSGETVVGDTSPQLGGNLDVNTKNILFGDSGGASDDRLIFGAGSDLQLYHDGSNSYLHQQSSATGNLLIFADGHEIQLIPKSGEPGIKVINDGAVELYHNGTKKLETASFGLRSSDSFYVDEHILIDNDSGRIKLGTGADLSIYHDGSHSRIVDSGTGHLIIQTSELDLMNAAGNADLIKATAGGSVELYENGTKVAETTSGGFNVEGVTYSNGLDMDDNHKILLGTGDDIEIYHDGSNNFIKSGNAGTNDLKIINTGNFIVETSDSEYLLRGIKNGQVDLYYNGVKKFETHDIGTIFTQASNSVANGAIKVNTTLDNYGSIIVRDQSDSNTTIGALEIENNSDGTNETNFVTRSVNLGSTAWAHAFHGAKSHRFGIQANVDGAIKFQVDLDGIKFNGDQSSDNALNDYEQGTWTPVWAAGGGSSGLANIANCEYVKIGELVHVRGEFALTGGSSNISTTDGWYITGLPFPNADASGSAGSWWASNAWTSGTRATGICMSYGTNTIYLGTEYASGMTRVNNIRHFAVTYRTN